VTSGRGKSFAGDGEENVKILSLFRSKSKTQGREITHVTGTFQGRRQKEQNQRGRLEKQCPLVKNNSDVENRERKHEGKKT